MLGANNSNCMAVLATLSLLLFCVVILFVNMLSTMLNIAFLIANQIVHIKSNPYYKMKKYLLVIIMNKYISFGVVFSVDYKLQKL